MQKQKDIYYYTISDADKLPYNFIQLGGLIRVGNEFFGKSTHPVEPGVLEFAGKAITNIQPIKEIGDLILEDLCNEPYLIPEGIPLRGWSVVDKIPEEDEFKWIDGLSAWDNPHIKIECVLPGLARGAVGSLVSPGGTGKSMLTLQTCVNLALGIKSCLNPHSKKIKVAYISAEDHEDMVSNRLKDALSEFEKTEEARTCVRENLRAVGVRKLLLGERGEVYPEKIIAKFNGFNPDLVIFDTVSRMHRFDENSASDMAMLLGAYEDIGHKLEAAVLVLHHTSKGAMFAKAQGNDVGSAASRGSSVLVDNARSVWAMSTMSKKEADGLNISNENRRNYVQLTQEKCNIDKWMDAQWFKRGDNGLLKEFSFSDAVGNETNDKVLTTSKNKNDDKASLF